MKRKLSMLLCAALLLTSLTGCGGKQVKNDGAEPTPAQKEFTLGTVTDNVYTSEYSGLQFASPEGWVFDTEEELVDRMADVLSFVDETDIYSGFQKRYMEMTSLYDMYASSPSGGSVQLSYERLDVIAAVKNYTTEEYAEATRTNLVTVYDQMFMNDPEFEGFNYDVGDVETVEIGGLEFLSIPVNLMDGLFKQAYYLHRIDDRMLNIVITGDLEYDPEDLLEYFSAYNT